MNARVALVGLMVALSVGAVGAAGFDDHPVNRWVKQSPREGAPVPRLGWEGSGDFDPYTNQWIHYGGHDGNPQGFVLFTWDLVTGRWRQRFPNTSPPGVCCVDGANVFDRANRRFIRFPGASLGHGWQWSRGVHLKASGVWTYDPETNEWTNMRPGPHEEPARYSRQVLGSLNAGGTYDSVHEVVLSFGGQGSAGGMNNLFVYDTYSNTLERLEAKDPPARRDGMGLCYDAANDCLVLFGSQYLSDEKTYIYRYKTNAWEAHDLSPRPPGKKEYGPYSSIPKMAYDSRNQVSLCLAWLDKAGHETWAFDAKALKWTKLSPAVEPDQSMSRSRNLTYSPEHNLFILESLAPGQGVQMWTYRYRAAPADPRPAALTGLTCATGADSAALAWSPVAGAAQYAVYHARGEKPYLLDYAKAAVVKEPAFVDRGVPAGQVTFYRVRAVDAEGRESADSLSVRTQPRVLIRPVVSVTAKDKVVVSWPAHPAKDVTGYHVYRGLCTIATTETAKGSWAYNNPPYDKPAVDSIRSIGAFTRLNEQPITGTTFADAVDLTKKGAESADYEYAVYAYVVTAVNALGVESGHSPYALTIPSAPQDFLCREERTTAHLQWQANPEQGLAGYRVYKMGRNTVERLTADPIQATTYAAPFSGMWRFVVCAVDALGQEGEPSSPVWAGHSYGGFYEGDWHQ